MTSNNKPKLGFGTAQAILVSTSTLFSFLLAGALGSTPGAAAGLATLCVPVLLNALFAWQLWRWGHRVPCGLSAGGEAFAVLADGIEMVAVGNPITAAPVSPSRGARDARPRPLVAPAGDPDAPFLARCANAAAALTAELAAAPDEAKRAAMAAWLCEHFQLRWEAAAAGSGATHDAEVTASFDAAAKALHALAMRYPASAAPLAQGAFAWDAPPLRAGGKAAVAHALHTWSEGTSEAVDSALFSSMGCWISPFTARLFAVFTFIYTLSALGDVASGYYQIHPASWAGIVTIALGFTAAAALLRAGRRDPARWVFAATFVTVTACYATETALSGCKCLGPYAETHNWAGHPAMRDYPWPGTRPWRVSALRNYPWQWTWYKAVATLGSLLIVFVASHPHHTFGIIFVLIPCLTVLGAVPMAITGHRLFNTTNCLAALFAAFFAGAGVFIWTGRSRALVQAHHMTAEDAARYTQLWEQQLLPTAGFREALRALEDAWREVQENALRLPKQVSSWTTTCRWAGEGYKRQLSAPSLHALLMQADELNDLLQAKLYDVCVAHGGEHHACGVKAEARALQKVFRSYQGDWRRLGDLCRTSLVFDAIPQLEACLRAISADTELEVVKAGDAKMRLREGFNAVKLSGGYRDVQLCVRLKSTEARARGVHEHLCEVQLHFAPIIALKSGGGHKTYVHRRNLSGQ